MDCVDELRMAELPMFKASLDVCETRVRVLPERNVDMRKKSAPRGGAVNQTVGQLQSLTRALYCI